MQTKTVNKKHFLLIALFPVILLAGCGGSSSDSNKTPEAESRFPEGAVMLPADNLTTAAKEAFINAKPGDVIVFPKGRFAIQGTLTFDGDSAGTGELINNITITGYGMEDTILDFKNATGGDGIFVQNGKDVTISDLGVYEAAANAIKLKNTDGVILRSVATVWDGELNQENGAYGLYPVECQNILIEDSYVRGSADAGIYVGQSSNIVVRNNVALENVAGIEIENSVNADVYGNRAEKNTGGILVFDLPIGNQLYGSNVRVFDNDVIDNNTENFANAGDFLGGVHIVPPGTGVILLAASDVEVYNNRISDHKTTSVVTTSYYIADDTLSYVNPKYKDFIDDGWEAVPRNVSIHNNEISKSSYEPTGDVLEDIIPGYMGHHQAFPAILYDGLGELIANRAIDSNTAGTPFFSEDAICSIDNSDVSHGIMFDPAGDGTAAAPPQSPEFLFEATQANLMACAELPPRLSPATATINGTAYGCEADDQNLAACAL